MKEQRIYTLPGGVRSKPLYAHQPLGIVQIINNVKARGYWALFDDCGLGKTCQIIYAVRCLMGLGTIQKAIIVCKASLATMWTAEFATYAPDLRVLCLTGVHRDKRKWGRADVIIINYELLSQKPGKRSAVCIPHPFTSGSLPLNHDATEFLKFLRAYKCLIGLDESQKIKTTTSRITQTLCGLQRYAVGRVIATATPEGEGPGDIWAQMYFLDGGNLLGKRYKSHCRRYIRYSLQSMQGRTMYIPIAFKNLPLLKKKIAGISTRRYKYQCLDLPDKLHVARSLTATTSEYAQLVSLRNTLLDCIEKEHPGDEISLFGPAAPVSISGYTQKLLVASAVPSLLNPMLPPGIKQRELLEVLNEDAGQILVYCHHRAVVAALVDFLTQERISTGYAISGNSDDGLAGFASGKYRVLVGTLDFLKEGANLQYSSHAVYYQLPWSRITWYQSQDRQHRIGQKNTVLLERFILNQSLDGYQYSLLSAKEAAARYSPGIGGAVKIRTVDFVTALRQI